MSDIAKIREALEYFDDDDNEDCGCRRCESIRAIRPLKAALPAVVTALQRVANLNPDAGTIGPGMLWNIVDAANEALSLLQAEKKNG